MHQTSFIIMLITVLSKVFGLVREKILAHYYGTSAIAESFITAFAIPMFLSVLITTAVATGYIPIYTQLDARYGKSRADKFTSNLINLSFLAALVLTAVSLFFTEEIVKIFATGFSGKTLETTVAFTRWGLLTLAFTTIASIMRGYLQTNDRFGVSVSQGLVMNLIIIVFLFLASTGNNKFLGYGIFVAMVGQYVIYLPSMTKLKYKHRWELDLKDPAIKEFVILMVPILIAVSVNELLMIINRSMASTIVEGGLAAINYANRLQTFVTGVVVTSITTVVLPSLSKNANDENWGALDETILSSSVMMGMLVIPGAIGLAIFAKPIVYLLFHGGKFDMAAVNLTGDALLFYSLGIIGFGIREVAVRVCYATKDMKTPVINAVFMVLINWGLNLILGKTLGIKGLALSATIACVVGAITLMISINKKIIKISWHKILTDVMKIAVATALMAIMAKLVFSLLFAGLGNNKSLLVAIFTGALIYLFMLWILRVEEFQKLLKQASLKN